MIGGRVLDTSALEHVATGRSVYAGLLLTAARAGAITLYVRRTPPFRDPPGSGHARETP